MKSMILPYLLIIKGKKYYLHCIKIIKTLKNDVFYDFFSSTVFSPILRRNKTTNFFYFLFSFFFIELQRNVLAISS